MRIWIGSQNALSTYEREVRNRIPTGCFCAGCEIGGRGLNFPMRNSTTFSIPGFAMGYSACVRGRASASNEVDPSRAGVNVLNRVSQTETGGFGCSRSMFGNLYSYTRCNENSQPSELWVTIPGAL